MSKPQFQISLGVDIAKKEFDAASLIEGKYKHKYFTNDVSSCTAFVIRFKALSGDIKPLALMGGNGGLKPAACGLPVQPRFLLPVLSIRLKLMFW